MRGYCRACFKLPPVISQNYFILPKISVEDHSIVILQILSHFLHCLEMNMRLFNSGKAPQIVLLKRMLIINEDRGPIIKFMSY